MRIIREAYTKEEIITRIEDTRNIMNALYDSLSILQSALAESGEPDLAKDTRLLSIDVDDMVNDFMNTFDAYIDNLDDEEEVDIDIEDEELYNENMINESSNGSVEDYFSKMKGKSKPEAQKIVMKAKGNPNAEKAYKKYLELNENTIKTKEEYISSDLAEKTQRKSIKNLYDRNELSIVKRDNFWYTESCPVKYFQIVKEEMKKYFPELTYLYDAEPYKSNVGKSISKKLQNESVNEDTVKTKDGKWTNKGDTGETHGKFKTKKEADAQRKAIFASRWKK